MTTAKVLARNRERERSHEFVTLVKAVGLRPTKADVPLGCQMGNCRAAESSHRTKRVLLLSTESLNQVTSIFLVCLRGHWL